ncbi:MAG: APC family permease [Pseudomonadota bacterium]
MSAPQLKRRLGFGLLTLYGVGVMIGAGIYVLVGEVAGQSGGLAPFAFLIAGLLALPTALSYSELSTRIPESAGEAAYLRTATGSLSAASAVGLAVAAVGVISAAAILRGGVGYLTAIVDLPEDLLIAGVGTALGALAILGVVESLAAAAILTFIELVGLAIVVFAGFSGPIVVQAPASAAGMEGLAAAGLLAFFAFIGFEDMVNMAEETRDPGRNMPRAIMAALVVTTLIYILVAWAAVRTVDAGELSESTRPLALVFERGTGNSSGFLAMIAAAAALNGVLAQMVMSARVLFGLGRSVRVFSVFHESHPRFGTPVRATLLGVAIVITLALSAPLADLAHLTSMILLAVFVAINLALIVIKRQRPLPDGFKVPVAVPIAGAILSFIALLWGVFG